MFARRTGWVLEPNALSREVEFRRERGLPLLDLTESNPTRCGFVYHPAAILGALADPAALRYEPEPRGLGSARAAVTRYYAERGVSVDPAQILLTASTSEAYAHLFRLLADPGDAVLAPAPSYPLFDFLAGLNDAEIIRYPLAYDAGWRIDLEALAAIAEEAANGPHPPRALLMVHPNNPTGSFVHQDELAAITALAGRFNLALIADEVFADYALEAHDSRRAPSHAGLDAVLTFTLSGLSKIAALPQMKLAWMVASGPRDAVAAALARLEIIADTYLSVGTPVAAALPELLETRRAMQPQIVERLRANLGELDRQLAAGDGGKGSRARASRLAAEGGWYAILKLDAEAREQANDEEWAVRLTREEGVLVHPGHFYDFAGDGHLVLSLLAPEEIFREGVGKLTSLLKNQPLAPDH